MKLARRIIKRSGRSLITNFVPDGIMYAFEDSWREYKRRCWKKKSKESSAKESKTEEA